MQQCTTLTEMAFEHHCFLQNGRKEDNAYYLAMKHLKISTTKPTPEQSIFIQSLIYEAFQERCKPQCR